jgi:thioesterase domain-containing protein
MTAAKERPAVPTAAPAPMGAAALTDFLRAEIPLTAALDVTVERYEPGLIRIAVPLAPNRNYRGVGFGGSLATLAIVTAWALVRQSALEAGIDAHPVVQRSDCEFLKPARSGFTAVSRLPDAAEWARFLGALREKGRARVDIDTEIESDGVCVLRQRARFFAMVDAAAR